MPSTPSVPGLTEHFPLTQRNGGAEETPRPPSVTLLPFCCLWGPWTARGGRPARPHQGQGLPPWPPFKVSQSEAVSLGAQRPPCPSSHLLNGRHARALPSGWHSAFSLRAQEPDDLLPPRLGPPSCAALGKSPNLSVVPLSPEGGDQTCPALTELGGWGGPREEPLSRAWKEGKEGKGQARKEGSRTAARPELTPPTAGRGPGKASERLWKVGVCGNSGGSC